MEPNSLTCYHSPFPKLRLGKDLDGGYIIADIPNIKYNIMLSGGILNDITFEEDFINKYPNIECFAYDGTINSLPKKNSKIRFIKQLIGSGENLTYKNKEYETTNLHNIIDAYDNIFIKMDIEGGEIPWINSLSEKQINKFEQIVIEFHSPYTDKEKYIFDKINKTHYLIHFHANNCCGTRIYKNVVMPNVFECTYVHKKHFLNLPKLNTDLIPSSLDMRNLKRKKEIFLNHPPFVHK
jgi:hypothetical protein